MARKLNTFVTVHERDDKGELTGQSGTFGPGGDLPGWARKAITNPDVWEGADDPEPGPPSGAQVPPRRGAGSGSAEWRAYAAEQGVEVPEDASRDDVIAALEAAGKPVNQ